MSAIDSGVELFGFFESQLDQTCELGLGPPLRSIRADRLDDFVLAELSAGSQR